MLKLLSEDFTHADVGKYVGVSRACITRFLSRYCSRKTIENLPRTGRPPKTSLRDDRHVLRVVKSNRRQSLREITNKPTVNNDLSIAVSSRTIRRRLRSCGYRRRKIRKLLTIARVNRLRRLSWCKTKLSWQAIGKWRSVIFSDETQVVLDHSRNVYVWRKPDEIWLPDCLGKWYLSRYRSRKTVENLPRTGRPPKTSLRDRPAHFACGKIEPKTVAERNHEYC